VLLARAAAFKLSASNYNVSETVGSATVTVLSAGDTSTAMSVRYATTPGTATAGADYIPTSGPLTFGVGETVKTFTVSIVEATLTEGAETIGLALSEPSGDSGLAVPNTGTVTILPNARRACNLATRPTACRRWRGRGRSPGSAPAGGARR
jgi:hypothetical protein